MLLYSMKQRSNDIKIRLTLSNDPSLLGQIEVVYDEQKEAMCANKSRIEMTRLIPRLDLPRLDLGTGFDGCLVNRVDLGTVPSFCLACDSANLDRLVNDLLRILSGQQSAVFDSRCE
jgi:hypothetical protein